ncbi:hypothetical protein GIB67_035224 [Kingdonia uniflora]|uniref:Uncharacterized protein n=1 Tax=Kingdonia uniflora TaxID=39325 RepID=A0A7J7KXS5_9MAGN|nr:hypothetical protein GIB67_035224 [Kingdonia uniflora]
MSSIDDTMSIHDGDDDDHLPRNLSRLSMCTNSSKNSNDYDMGVFMSFSSIDDSGEDFFNNKGLSSDSDRDISSYVSLPTTPSRRRQEKISVGKDYASENEARNAKKGGLGKTKRSSRRSVVREKGLERAWEEKKKKFSAMDDIDDDDNDVLEEERSIIMDLEEVKACRDLGFQFGIPSRISRSCSTLDTASSGGNSPIANWKISSPGDDPKDVKARLKVWAQAVALASTSHLFG